MDYEPSAAFWRGRRVVVTGGTGFLGSHLMTQLSRLGASVVSCSRREGCDLRDGEQARQFLAAHKPEFVFNCAAHQGGVAYQRVRPATILYDNVLMSLHTMEAARMCGVERYVNVIAACAYPGEPRDTLLREDEIDDGPMHPSADNYGISKRVALLQAKHYASQFNFMTQSVVLANTYGPGDHFSPERSHVVGGLIRSFLDARRNGLAEVQVWGTGRAERDLVFVDDAVTGTLMVVEHASDVDLVNVGSGRGHPVAEIAETVRQAVGYTGKITFDHSKAEGPLKKTLDVSRIQALLGWNPRVSLEYGVRRTVSWLEQHPEALVGSN